MEKMEDTRALDDMGDIEDREDTLYRKASLSL